MILPPEFFSDPWGRYKDQEDFHSPVTISLGELIRDGVVVWGEPEWMWDYYDIKQYWRVSEKIENHYWDRQIGVLPPGSWRREFVRTMNEIMPKYKLAYKALEDQNSILVNEDRYGKERRVGSDFPATLISPRNQDYASDASDREYEDVVQGNTLDQLAKLSEYDDIDLQIVERVDRLFTSLITVNMNGGMGI